MVIGHHNLCKYIAKGLCTKLQSQLQASSSQSQPQTQGYSSSSSVSVSLSSSSCAFSSPPSSWGRWLWSRRWTGVSTTAAIDFLAPLAILRPELTVMVRLEAAASSTWKGGVMKMLGCPPWRRRRWGWQGHPCPWRPSRCWAGWQGWPRPPCWKSWHQPSWLVLLHLKQHLSCFRQRKEQLIRRRLHGTYTWFFYFTRWLKTVHSLT